MNELYYRRGELASPHVSRRGELASPFKKFKTMYNINELKEKFNNKKVLITGHTGFKGSYLCVLLNLLNAKVFGYALEPEKNSLYEILKDEIKNNNEEKKLINKLVEKEIFDDIRNYDALYNFVKEVDPDFIIHMAAQPIVLEGYKNPKYTFDVNVMGTVNLLEAIRCTYSAGSQAHPYDTVGADTIRPDEPVGVSPTKSHSRERARLSTVGVSLRARPLSVLNVTTDKVYENKDLENYKFKEDDKLMGDDPYANSKSCSELVTHSYKNSFFDENKNITISCARAGNVIGGGDFAKNRIVPDIYRAYVENKDVELRNPDSTRPYQFVLEPLIIYLNILMYQYENIDDKNKYEGCYNVGPDADDILTTKALAEKVCDKFGKNDVVADITRSDESVGVSLRARSKSDVGVDIIRPQTNAHEKKFLCLDNNLIKKVFGYKKIFSNEEMIENTVKVYEGIFNKSEIIPIISKIVENIK